MRNDEDVTVAPTAEQVDAATEVEVALVTVVDVATGREKMNCGAGQSVKHFWQLDAIPFSPVRSN